MRKSRFLHDSIILLYSTFSKGFFLRDGGLDKGICVHNGNPLQTTPLFADISVSTSLQFRSDISTCLNSSNLTVLVSVCLFHLSSAKKSYFETFESW